MHEIVRITRNDLYEKVWSMPLRKAAKDFGISDVALGKACRKLQIPLPGRGFWLREAAQRQRLPLAPAPDGCDDLVSFHVSPSHAVPASSNPREPPAPVFVTAQLTNPHSLIARTRRLRRKPISDKGWVSLDLKEAMHLKVTAAAFDRALRLMDALIKASEVVGFMWRVTDTGKTIVEINGQAVEVALVEKLVRREVSPPASTGRTPASMWAYHSRIKYEPTGLLSFRIDQPTYGISARKTWNDTPRRSLDHQLAEILAGLPAIAAAIHARDEEREAQQREREAERELRAQLARKEEGGRRLRLRMVTHMRSWERATRLRSFVSEVERKGAIQGANAAELEAWLTWAKENIECLDPILSDIEAVVSLTVEVPEHFDSAYHYGPRPIDWWQLADDDA